MSDFRKEKIQELIMHLASNYIEREASRKSLITVTRASLSDDLKEIVICVSVLPDNESENALNFLKRQRSEFKKYVKDNSLLSPIPFVDFELDLGEKNRQKIDEISKDL